MFISKKTLASILSRLDALENGNQKIVTAEHGAQSLTYYIRLFYAATKKDRSLELRSFGKSD